MEDIQRQCIDCPNAFTITVKEQEFYNTKRDRETGEPLKLPRRCPDCRALKRQRQEQGMR